jgi:mRNA interferase MazF
MRRGDIWWASLAEPDGSGPGFRRPVLIVQSDSFNKSRIQTVVVVAITSNLHLSDAPGNVFLKRSITGLKKDSVANVSQILTMDKRCLTERVSKISPTMMKQVSEGLNLVLSI